MFRISVLALLAFASVAQGCSSHVEHEPLYPTPFECPVSAEPYRELMSGLDYYTLRDTLEAAALGRFEPSCLADCALSGEMIACTRGSCATAEGGVVSYERVVTLHLTLPDDPSVAIETTTLQIAIDNPSGSSLQQLELVSETIVDDYIEDSDYSLDFSASWTGSISDDFPADSSLRLEYSGGDNEGCFYRQSLLSESPGCSAEIEVVADRSEVCSDTCDFTVIVNGGSPLATSGECPRYR
jgi:hypothetical protein